MKKVYPLCIIFVLLSCGGASGKSQSQNGDAADPATQQISQDTPSGNQDDGSEASGDELTLVTYSNDIRPIMQAKCDSCHGAGRSNASLFLSDTYSDGKKL